MGITKKHCAMHFWPYSFLSYDREKVHAIPMVSYDIVIKLAVESQVAN